MGFLTALGGPIVKALADSLFGKVADTFQAYFQKQITEAQLKEKLVEALLSTFAEVEKAYAASLTATFSSFMNAAAQSKFMQHVWGAVALSQLVVLLWHQVGISALVAAVRWSGHTGWSYPSSGSTVDWAYALLALCLGGGAISLKMGPGSGSLVDGLKRLAGK